MTGLEMIDLLERCGYEPSLENTVLLKYGLSEGIVWIENEYPEYYLNSLLESAGYEATDKSRQALAETLDSVGCDFEALNETWVGDKFRNLGTRIQTKAQNNNAVVKGAFQNLGNKISGKAQNLKTRISGAAQRLGMQVKGGLRAAKSAVIGGLTKGILKNPPTFKTPEEVRAETREKIAANKQATANAIQNNNKQTQNAIDQRNKDIQAANTGRNMGAAMTIARREVYRAVPKAERLQRRADAAKQKYQRFSASSTAPQPYPIPKPISGDTAPQPNPQSNPNPPSPQKPIVSRTATVGGQQVTFMRNPNLKENAYTDSELYQILESSGYKTTEKNLAILKEGLESGKYCLE